MRRAASSEVLGALIVIVVGATIGIIVFLTYSESEGDLREIIIDENRFDTMRASELLAVSHSSHILQTRQFILHNYSDDSNLSIHDFAVYIVREDGSIQKGDPNGLQMFSVDSDIRTISIDSQESVLVKFTGLGCGRTMVLVTPSDEMIIVEPPIEDNCLDKCPNDHKKEGGLCVPRCLHYNEKWDKNNQTCVIEDVGKYYWDRNGDSIRDSDEHIMNPCVIPQDRFDVNRGSCIPMCGDSTKAWIVHSRTCEDIGTGKIECVRADQEFISAEKRCKNRCSITENWNTQSKTCDPKKIRIFGTVWWDVNFNGKKDTTEDGYPGYTMSFYPPYSANATSTTMTNSTGIYSADVPITVDGLVAKPGIIPENGKIDSDSLFVPFETDEDVEYDVAVECNLQYKYQSNSCVERCPLSDEGWDYHKDKCVKTSCSYPLLLDDGACMHPCPGHQDIMFDRCIPLFCKPGEIAKDNKCTTCDFGHISVGNSCQLCDGTEIPVGNTCQAVKCDKGEYSKKHVCIPGDLTLTVFIFHDLNDSDKFDSGDRPLDGFTVTASSSKMSSTKTCTTDSSGECTLSGLVPDDEYTVKAKKGNDERGNLRLSVPPDRVEYHFAKHFTFP